VGFLLEYNMKVIREILEYSPVFIYGKTNNKSLLVKTLVLEFMRAYRKPCLYVTAEDFSRDLLYSIMNQQKELFKQKYRNNDLLIIDNLEFLSGKDKIQEELLLILKYLETQNRRIILIADRLPKLISKLDKDLITSCYGGLILSMKELSKHLLSKPSK
jgi:chromosomal replication initiator protein